MVSRAVHGVFCVSVVLGMGACGEDATQERYQSGDAAARSCYPLALERDQTLRPPGDTTPYEVSGEGVTLRVAPQTGQCAAEGALQVQFRDSHHGAYVMLQEEGARWVFEASGRPVFVLGYDAAPATEHHVYEGARRAFTVLTAVQTEAGHRHELVLSSAGSRIIVHDVRPVD